MKSRLIIAVHGILTSQTAKAWQERFVAHVIEHCAGSRIAAIAREYWLGPFPILNTIINWFIARSLANEIERDYLAEPPIDLDVCFVTHSNGAAIAARTMKLLAARGHKIKSVVFIAGAIRADIKKNGIEPLIGSGMLGNAWAYCSRGDLVLGKIPGIFLWPYGRLGCEGFCDGRFSPLTQRIRTRWFKDYDHGTYFDPAHETATFEQAIHDCCFST